MTRKRLNIVLIFIVFSASLSSRQGMGAENPLNELVNRLERVDSVRYENVKYYCSAGSTDNINAISADSLLFNLRLDYQLFKSLKKLRFEGKLSTGYWRWAKSMMAEDKAQAELLKEIKKTRDNLRFRGKLDLSLASTRDILLNCRNLSDRLARMKGYENDFDLHFASLGVPREIIEPALDKLADALRPVISEIYSETLQAYCLNTASAADMIRYVNENGQLYDGWFTREKSKRICYQFWRGIGFEETSDSMELIPCDNIFQSVDNNKGVYIRPPEIYILRGNGYSYYQRLIQGYGAAVTGARLQASNQLRFIEEITNSAVEQFFYETATSVSYLCEHILMNKSYRGRYVKFQRYRELLDMFIDIWIAKAELYRLKVNENKYPSIELDSGARFLKGYISGDEDFEGKDFSRPFEALKRLFIRSASLDILRTFERQLGKPLYKNGGISVFVKNNLFRGNSGDDSGSNLQKVGINPFDISSLIDYYGF
ncbi:MAG: hypothetical protein GF307_12960 [candidate division Zixibacteria bacterium]|nr:hypothetical protein [candidate division Zixibacteria bacterium]